MNEGLEKMVRKEYEKYIVVPDMHVPYHDKQTLKTVLKFIREQKPDHVVLIGDVMDMYSVSKYNKNPSRANHLQDEVDVTQAVLESIRKASGKVPITYLEGNHEVRMQKFLWANPELFGLRNLEIPNLLDLKKYNIIYQEDLQVGNFLFTHGRRVNMYSSRWELEDNGMSGMSGHTHRIQSHAKTNRMGVGAWYSIGHICDVTKAEYVKNPNWQQGLGVVHFKNTNKNRFYAEVIPIINHQFIYGGKLYTPRNVKRYKK